MELLYKNEHQSCLFYSEAQSAIFKLSRISEGERLELLKKNNYIIFILSGSLRVTFGEYPNHLFNEGEFLFLPMNYVSECTALKESEVIVLTYDSHVTLCKRVALDSLNEYKKETQFEFKGLKMNSPLKNYLTLLKTYLKEEMNCSNLHKIKQEEFFSLLRAFYTKEELSNFFYYSLALSIPFKEKVANHYSVNIKNARALADMCGYSERVFNRMFHEHFGKPPYQWMLDSKSKHVKTRLTQKEINFKTIIDEFGFSSPSHFTNFCKKYLGDTPMQLRRELTRPMK